MTGPLDGIRILDLTTMLLGPLAAQILGDMGADVIKVEAPDGDAVRAIGPARHHGMAALFLNINRNKRSLVLDLKQTAARAAVLRLAANADVFLHSMRPQAIARLGLGYDELAAVNPKIIYCGAVGFGRAGPYHRKAALDDIIQAASGLAEVQGGLGGAPAYVNSPVADKTVALFVVYAIAMALFHRERTGAGQAIEVPMFETMVAFNVVEHLYGLSFEPPLAWKRIASVCTRSRLCPWGIKMTGAPIASYCCGWWMTMVLSSNREPFCRQRNAIISSTALTGG